MKRFALIILSFILTISFASCTMTLDNPNDTTPIGTKPVTTDETDKPSDSTNANDSEDQTTSSTIEPDEIAIEETTLYDKDGIKVIAKEWVEDFWGDGIKLYIENNTDKDINLQVNHMIVNNFMIPTVLFSAEVAAGKKTHDTLTISEDTLEKCGITKIGLIEVDMYTYDSNEYERIAELGHAAIKTNLYNQTDGISGDGDVLLDQNGIKVIGRYIEEDTFWGASVVLYMESDKDVVISAESLSVNGFSLTALSSFEILAGRKIVDAITIFESNLEENDITEIEEIEFKLKVMEKDTYKEIFTSDIITCVPNK